MALYGEVRDPLSHIISSKLAQVFALLAIGVDYARF